LYFDSYYTSSGSDPDPRHIIYDAETTPEERIVFFSSSSQNYPERNFYYADRHNFKGYAGASSTTLDVDGALIADSVNAGSGSIQTTGSVSTGALTATSVDAGSGSITTTGSVSTGALTATSVDAGSGFTAQANTMQAANFSTAAWNSNAGGSMFTRELWATEIYFNNSLSTATLSGTDLTLSTQGHTYETFDFSHTPTAALTLSEISLSNNNRVNAQYVVSVENNSNTYDITIPTTINCSLGGNTPFAFKKNFSSNVVIPANGCGILTIFYKSSTIVFLSASAFA
jgi:hypothetical protein